MTISIALIGSGIFAKEEHLPAIQSTSTLSLKAIYSRSLKSAKTLAENLDVVELYSEDQEGRTYDDLLKRDDIQAVIIALPILVQPDYIQRALRASKHVLAEKPIAKDIATARSLIDFASSQTPTLSIAENFRYLDSFQYAARQLSQLGRVLTFRTRISAYVKPGGKYYETPWRKVPEYQGGFLLDGGVHFIAGTRLLLSAAGAKAARVTAFTAQLQKHLPPVDTLHAVLQLDNETKASGTLTISFGTSDTGSEYLVAAENGSVHVSRGTVTITRDGQVVETKEFRDEGAGVKQEVKAWAEALSAGKRNERQGPEEALADLEVLEAGLRSGELGGRAVELRLQ